MAKRKKPGGNPAKNAWEPLEIGPAQHDGRPMGMAYAFYTSGGTYTRLVRERLSQLAMEPATGSPADFSRLIESDLKLWGQIISDTGVRAPG